MMYGAQKFCQGVKIGKLLKKFTERFYSLDAREVMRANARNVGEQKNVLPYFFLLTAQAAEWKFVFANKIQTDRFEISSDLIEIVLVGTDGGAGIF